MASIAFITVIIGIQLPLYLVGTNAFNVTTQGVRFSQTIGYIWIVILSLTVFNNLYAILLLTQVKRVAAANDLASLTILWYCQLTCALLSISCIGALITRGILATINTRRAISVPNCYLDHLDIAVRSGRVFFAFANLVCVIFASYHAWGSRRISPVRGRDFTSNLVTNVRRQPPSTKYQPQHLMQS